MPGGGAAIQRPPGDPPKAITDPDTPTLPPHITFEQAKHFTETILRGDPDTAGIVKQAIKGMVQSFMPHSEKETPAQTR